MFFVAFASVLEDRLVERLQSESDKQPTSLTPAAVVRINVTPERGLCVRDHIRKIARALKTIKQRYEALIAKAERRVHLPGVNVIERCGDSIRERGRWIVCGGVGRSFGRRAALFFTLLQQFFRV
jgi:hypothetical protein